MILHSVCVWIYIACLFFFMFTRKGSRRVLKHLAGGWKTQFHLHAIAPSIQIWVPFSTVHQQNCWASSSLTAHVQSHGVVPGPVSNNGCLRRTIWAGWASGELSTGHPPVPSKWQTKDFAHLGCLPSLASHTGNLDCHNLTARQIMLI